MTIMEPEEVLLMVLAESLVVGILGVLAYAAVISLILWTQMPNEGVGAIALPGWMVLIGAMLCFFGAFYWMLRRSS